eukprot:m.20408 g.20408  ORF g.20408 m.20408 type:complete len:338 (-) comp3530_c0_seq1:1023-2036(-)
MGLVGPLVGVIIVGPLLLGSPQPRKKRLDRLADLWLDRTGVRAIKPGKDGVLLENIHLVECVQDALQRRQDERIVCCRVLKRLQSVGLRLRRRKLRQGGRQGYKHLLRRVLALKALARGDDGGDEGAARLGPGGVLRVARGLDLEEDVVHEPTRNLLSGLDARLDDVKEILKVDGIHVLDGGALVKVFILRLGLVLVDFGRRLLPHLELVVGILGIKRPLADRGRRNRCASEVIHRAFQREPGRRLHELPRRKCDPMTDDAVMVDSYVVRQLHACSEDRLEDLAVIPDDRAVPDIRVRDRDTRPDNAAPPDHAPADDSLARAVAADARARADQDIRA